MKTTKHFSIIASLFLASSIHSFAIVGLGIERQCADIVLSWPSTGNEHYLIQYRPTLDPSTPWTNLTNNYPANSTNRTTYTVYGVVPPCPSGGSSMMSAPMTSAQRTAAKETREAARLVALYEKCQALGREPYDWEIKDVPPMPPAPEEVRAKILKAKANQAAKLISGASLESDSLEAAQLEGPSGVGSENEPEPQNAGAGNAAVDCGFYRVFLVPDFYFNYSTYQFTDGVEFLPINLGADPNIVVKIEILVDGKVFRNTEPAVVNLNFGTPSNPDIRPTFGLWFFSDRLTNGTHQLQLQTTLQLDRKLNQNTPYLTLTNLAKNTSLNNPIVFAPWKTLMVGTNHAFKAKTTIVPSDWYIDVYDAYGFWVTGASGTTTDGNISWTWDFYDDFSNLRDAAEYDPYFDPYVTVIGTSSSAQNAPQAAGASAQRPAPLSSPDYPTVGGWLIAYQDNAKFIPAARDALNQAFSSLGGGPASLGLPNTTLLLKYGNTNDVDMTADPVQNMINRNASWDNLRNALLYPQYRNLFIFAHGSGFSIGGDWERFTNSPSGPQPDGSESDLNEYMIGTNKIYSTAQLTSGWCYRLHHLVDAPHPYRFVFLDGCATATGDWPYPFGIIPATNSLNYYKIDGERPDAFVGWNQTINYANKLGKSKDGWADFQKFANFRTEWMTLWRYPGTTNTEELWHALDKAAQNSGWVTPQKLSEIICIYGFNDLKFNEYNQGNFTFPP